MSLIHDIQIAAISQATDIPTLLRMCKLLAARISHPEMEEWVDHELNGYPNVASLPQYRVVSVESHGSFHGPFGRANDLQIPLSVLPTELREQFQNAYLGSSISVYVNLLQDNVTGRITESWPLEHAVHYASTIMNDMQCVKAWKEIPIGAVVQLLDSVKTRILGFAIDLEREAPNAGEMPVGSQSPLSSKQMTRIFNTNITGNVGNISNSGENFTQNASTQPRNWDALVSDLASFGLEPDDLASMRADLDRTPLSQVEKQTVASTWISRLLPKAITGASGVGVEAAATGIAKAIASYLGLPGS